MYDDVTVRGYSRKHHDLFVELVQAINKYGTCRYVKYKNKNPVAMHTFIMCMNILQNIKVVPPKL